MYIYILFNLDKFPMIVIISYSQMCNVLPIKSFQLTLASPIFLI